ncbi:MAG: KilA-N domain-containing protein, partial [Dolichospermum sp.]
MFGGAANTPNAVNLYQRFTMEIILHETNGLQIGQRRDDGYINATRMCQAHNKEWRYYWRLPSTQEYVNALAEDLG